MKCYICHKDNPREMWFGILVETEHEHKGEVVFGQGYFTMSRYPLVFGKESHEVKLYVCPNCGTIRTIPNGYTFPSEMEKE